jgi:phosphonate transport system substrate-binding protein
MKENMKRTIAILSIVVGAATAHAADPETLIVAFQPQENPERLQLNAEAMTKYLSTELGMPVKIYLPTDYAAVVEALRAGHAHVAYFSAWPYLLAHNLAGADVLVAEERNGRPFYYSQWYARADSPIESLADARGKRAAFTAPSSTSGYLFPLAKLIEDGLLEPNGDPMRFFSRVVFAGGYEQALKALLNGQVDVAAASDYAPDRYLTDTERRQLKVIARQGPVPTHCIAAKNSLSPALRARIQTALLKLNEPEHKSLLKSVYGAEKLVPVTHSEHTAALARALQLTGLDYSLKTR